jgi:tetratricopeptide (TPR) repeat protein
MGRRASVVAGLGILTLLAAHPAWAVKEWYDYYLTARDQQIPRGQYAEAIKSLREAIRLKPNPALQEQTYGLDFQDYLPYYHLGLCHLKLGEFEEAMRYFGTEEERGAIRKHPLYAQLTRLRTDAENGQREHIAREARRKVESLIKEGRDLERARKFEDALNRLVQAQGVASGLDPGLLSQIVEMKDRIAAAQRADRDAVTRAQRIAQALADGRRLLEEDKPTEAVVRFDEVLALDAHDAAALDGKQLAQEMIRTSRSRQALADAFREGKALFDKGEYEKALPLLTDAAADPANAEARTLLERTQKIREGIRSQQDLRQRIDALKEEGERAFARGLYADAQVRFEGVLALDPGDIKAAERLAVAERRTGEALLATWLPNLAPALTFFEPRLLEVTVEGPSLAVVGVASDDRGIERLEFRLGGEPFGEQAPPQRLDTGDTLRNLRFEREFPLKEGMNEISVTAVDLAGVSRAETFRITRRLRFYETRAFLPSAGAIAVGLVGAGLGVQRARRRRALRNRFNPYIAGAPVLSDEMFFGRSKLLARILNVIHHNSLVITGERRIGKTTFLYHLKRVLEKDEGSEYKFFPVFTDLQGVPESSFFHTVMADVSEGLALSPDTRAALRFRPEQEDYDGRDFSHDLQRVIEELKARTVKRVKLALLIDEVDALNSYSERVNQRLRSIFMKTFSEHLVAIMSGVGIRRVWNSEVSPWYNFFDEVELAAFSREEAEALIRTPVEGFFQYQAEAVEAILEHSELKPYLIQKFCIHAVNRMLEAGRTVIQATDVHAVRDAVQFESRGEDPRAHVHSQAPA